MKLSALKIGISAAAIVVALSGAAMAREVKSIAILTPEQGTDYGWNQQGVDAAKAAGEEGRRRRSSSPRDFGYGDVRPTCANWPPTGRACSSPMPAATTPRLPRSPRKPKRCRSPSSTRRPA